MAPIGLCSGFASICSWCPHVCVFNKPLHVHLYISNQITEQAQSIWSHSPPERWGVAPRGLACHERHKNDWLNVSHAFTWFHMVSQGLTWACAVWLLSGCWYLIPKHDATKLKTEPTLTCPRKTRCNGEIPYELCVPVSLEQPQQMQYAPAVWYPPTCICARASVCWVCACVWQSRWLAGCVGFVWVRSESVSACSGCNCAPTPAANFRRGRRTGFEMLYEIWHTQLTFKTVVAHTWCVHSWGRAVGRLLAHAMNRKASGTHVS